MKDILGDEIKVNQYVAYATRSSCYAELYTCRVLETQDSYIKVIRMKKTWRDGKWIEVMTKSFRLTHPERLIIIPQLPKPYKNE